MLRVLVIAVSIAIIGWGIIQLIKLFSPKRVAARKAASLEKLQERARKTAAEKERIQAETQRNKEVIDDINNTLNQ